MACSDKPMGCGLRWQRLEAGLKEASSAIEHESEGLLAEVARLREEVALLRDAVRRLQERE